jgi:hypothetical protein
MELLLGSAVPLPAEPGTDRSSATIIRGILQRRLCTFSLFSLINRRAPFLRTRVLAPSFGLQRRIRDVHMVWIVSRYGDSLHTWQGA